MFDTGPLVSLYDPNDGSRPSILAAFQEMQTRGWPICICELTIAEAHNRIRIDISADAGRNFLDNILTDIGNDDLNLIEIMPEDRTEAASIINKYSDQSISYTDAITMSVMKRMGIVKVLAVDWHYTLVGFITIPPLPDDL